MLISSELSASSTVFYLINTSNISFVFFYIKDSPQLSSILEKIQIHYLINLN